LDDIDLGLIVLLYRHLPVGTAKIKTSENNSSPGQDLSRALPKHDFTKEYKILKYEN
jgi:hypothetical protein